MSVKIIKENVIVNLITHKQLIKALDKELIIRQNKEAANSTLEGLENVKQCA